MKKTNKEIEREVIPDFFYKPREIINNGWIYGEGHCNYWFILRKIRAKHLMARDFGLGKVPHYRIKGSEIIRYIKKWQ